MLPPPSPSSFLRQAGEPLPVYCWRGKGRYCLDWSRKRRVWEEERKKTAIPVLPGWEKPGIGKPKEFSPNCPHFPHPFFFLLGGSTRSHLQQCHSKTHEVTAPPRVPSMLHPRRWDLIGVEKCHLPPTSSGGADFSGLLLFLRPTVAEKKKIGIFPQGGPPEPSPTVPQCTRSQTLC